MTYESLKQGRTRSWLLILRIATIKDEKLADKIDAGDKKKINDTIEETLKWLELNQRRAETEEFEHKLKEIERICSPLMIKLYDGTGGPHSGAGGNSAEPTIEVIVLKKNHFYI